MLKIKFDPNTNVLAVESERTTKFKEKVVINGWYTILDLQGKDLLYIQMIEEGSDFIVNVEGLDEDKQPDGYDISDLLSTQKIQVVAFTKKCVLVEVKVQNGEYEYYSKSMHVVGKDVNIRKIGERHAKTFYANFSYEDDGTYYFNGGEVAAQLYKAEEVTRQEYQILRKFIS